MSNLPSENQHQHADSCNEELSLGTPSREQEEANPEAEYYRRGFTNATAYVNGWLDGIDCTFEEREAS